MTRKIQAAVASIVLAGVVLALAVRWHQVIALVQRIAPYDHGVALGVFAPEASNLSRVLRWDFLLFAVAAAILGVLFSARKWLGDRAAARP